MITGTLYSLPTNQSYLHFKVVLAFSKARSVVEEKTKPCLYCCRLVGIIHFLTTTLVRDRATIFGMVTYLDQ